MTTTSIRVLFVCTGNAGRSQIAEALLRTEALADVSVSSAGVEPWEDLHPMAVQVMAARGVKMTGQHPKAASSVAGQRFDIVVTIGTPARQKLPRALKEQGCWLHWDLADPADADNTPESQPVFERTADAIAKRLSTVTALIQTLRDKAPRARLQPGIATGLWRKGFDPATHLPMIRNAGFAAIELNLFYGKDHFDASVPGAIRDVRRISADLGLDVWSIHSPDLASLATADAQKQRTQIDAILTCLDIADELGAHCVVSHGLIVKPARETDVDAHEARLMEAVEHLSARAQPSCARVAFENGFSPDRHWPARDLLRRMEALPDAGFGLCIDTGHANIAGDQQEIIAATDDRLITLHLNDNNAKVDNHRRPGAGCVDWPAIGQWLQNCRYNGCLIYELVTIGDETPEDILAHTANWHQQWWQNACSNESAPA